VANRNSKYGRKRGSSKIFWLIIALVTGGGISGFLNPDWPVVGPLVTSVKTKATELGSRTASGLDNSGVSDVQANSGAYAGTPVQSDSALGPNDKILVASFNIQVFGESKLAKPDAMAVIVEVIRKFDVIAIQEVRAKADDILPRLIAMLNADGSRYDFIIGPRLGRSVSKEQYAFVYDTNRIELDSASVGTIGDPGDMLHRAPFIARFRPRTSDPDRAFTFWLVDTHTDPDDVPEEVDALAQVFQVMQTARPDEDDVILLGDLNASEKQLGDIKKIPGIQWAVGGGVMTNTRQSKAYDNIIFHGPSTQEFTGKWNVLNFEQEFNLSREEALRVSDHFPVWAEFDVWESANPVH
jgi:deoxyribonuclease-1-like protein